MLSDPKRNFKTTKNQVKQTYLNSSLMKILLNDEFMSIKFVITNRKEGVDINLIEKLKENANKKALEKRD